ncbi:MAG: TolC family protein [Brotaphodocola sp.]
MKMLKRAALLGLSAVMLTAAPMTALAGSPEFARSAEEWAKLRDNVLEYDELAGLIHEYNATVQKAGIDYNEFRKEYGDTNDEVADRYYELAADLRSLDYPDIDDDNYASMMARIISSEMTADQYEQTADDALEDSYTKYMTNCQTEANLVASAQTEMINYYINQLQLEIAQKKREMQQDSYQSTINQLSAGMATEVNVLTALENVHNAEQTIQNTQSAIDTGRQKLLVMTGWKATDTPEIREIPAVDMERIGAMDPEADREAALANSYSQLINLRKLENSRSEDKRETLQTSIAENERSIYATLNAKYQSVLAYKTAYDLAVAQSGLSDQSLQMAERMLASGDMSQLDYRVQKNSTEISRLSVKVAELNLFQAMESYDWAVNGLAGS